MVKLMKPINFDIELYNRFERVVPSGDRSRVISGLVEDYLDRFFPEKEAKGLSRELDIRTKKAELEELLEQERAIDDRQQKELLEAERVRSLKIVESTRQSFEEDCRAKAKQLTNLEFGFEPLMDFLPDGVKSEVREQYMSRWKALTTELIEKKDKDGEE